MSEKSKDLVVSLGPVKQEGIAKGAKGRSLIRISSAMTFTDVNSGLKWHNTVEAFVLVAPSGDLEPGQFSEADGFARLTDAGETAERTSFEFSLPFALKEATRHADVHETGPTAFLISGMGSITASVDKSKVSQVIELKAFALRSTSGSSLQFFPDLQKAKAALHSSKVALPTSPRRSTTPR